jgi:hypothetical protein
MSAALTLLVGRAPLEAIHSSGIDTDISPAGGQHGAVSVDAVPEPGVMRSVVANKVERSQPGFQHLAIFESVLGDGI